MKEIKVKQIKVEVKESGGLEILYQPETRQLLEAGKLYKFVFDPPLGTKIIMPKERK